MRVLLVEDDEILADGLLRSLRQADFAVDWVGDGADALEALHAQPYDLVVLDLNLPSKDGLDIVRELRDLKLRMPVLIVTARSEVADRIAGLDLGADDYLTKPFELGEFDARVRALLRRSQSEGLGSVEMGGLTLDVDARRVYLHEVPLELPRREFHILEALMTRRGRILSKEQIVDCIAEFDEELSPSAVEIYVHRLRKKLEAGDVVIRTVRGVGYTFE